MIGAGSHRPMRSCGPRLLAGLLACLVIMAGLHSTVVRTIGEISNSGIENQQYKSSSRSQLRQEVRNRDGSGEPDACEGGEIFVQAAHSGPITQIFAGKCFSGRPALAILAFVPGKEAAPRAPPGPVLG